VAITTAISASVGKLPAVNKRADVIEVQKLLNKAGAGLKEDGNCGAKTISAIVDYQRNFLALPDGKVDPGGTTWRNLVAGTLKVKREALVLLPQACGHGYYSYSAMPRQYGTSACIQTLRDVCDQFKLNMQGLEVGVGDISFAQGGEMQPHNSHRNGLDVDIRPLRTDKQNAPVDIAHAQYSRDFTKTLVESLLAHRNVKGILFNDKEIKHVTQWAGHDNHLHVTMKS